MEFTINKTRKLIREIEKKRMTVNNYGVIYDFCDVFDKLQLKSGDTGYWDDMHDWIDTYNLIVMFGADAVNPVIISGSNGKKFLCRYDDNGRELSREDYDPDFY